MKIVSVLLAFAGMFVISTTVHAQYADAVLSYNPGAGYVPGYTNTSSALGAPASGGSVNPMSPPFSKSQLISIGAGGEITLQMDTPIIPSASNPYGLDFIIFANSFFVANSGSGQNETASGSLFYHPVSALIQVSADGLNWFTLNPAIAPQPGEWFPTYGGGNPQVPVNPALTNTAYAGMTLGQIETLYGGSAGGTGYSLSWAQDTNGNSVDLPSADYVQINVESGVLNMDAISVVPEPSTWALVLAGATMLFFSLKSRTVCAVRVETRKFMVGRTTRAFCCAAVSANRPSTSGGSQLWKSVLALLFSLLMLSSARAVTFTENFTNDPAQNGWQVFGDTNLFQWDSTNHVMDVTWDSSQTNSYFSHPLGTTLTRNDNFTIAFDLELNVAEGSGYSFQTALGLLNYSEAINTNFQRGLGYSPDLVEFDYFPGTTNISGPTVWPTFVGSTDDFSYNGTNDYQLYQPNLGDWYHIVMTYNAASQTMITTMTNFEQTTGITAVDPISPGFSDFSVDTFSINCYQDDGMGDSIFAQGEVSNLVLTLPPEVRNLSCTPTNGACRVQCVSDVNWNYVLERSADLVSWADISTNSGSMGTVLTFNDTNAPAMHAYYRVRVSQP